MCILQFFFIIFKEVFIDVEVISQKMMLCVGYIKCVVVGIYIWMLFGLCVLCKVENIVCEEMNNVGVMELLMLVV